MAPRITYATKCLGNYCNAASVYYDRPDGQPTSGTGNTFVIADHNDDLVVIQGRQSTGVDEVSFTFPRGAKALYDDRAHEQVDVGKYGQSGSCVLIGENLHCYLPIQVKRGTINATELWHLIVSDIIVR